MLQNSPSIYVSLDVHKESLSVAIASPERGFAGRPEPCSGYNQLLI